MRVSAGENHRPHASLRQRANGAGGVVVKAHFRVLGVPDHVAGEPLEVIDRRTVACRTVIAAPEVAARDERGAMKKHDRGAPVTSAMRGRRIEREEHASRTSP